MPRAALALFALLLTLLAAPAAGAGTAGSAHAPAASAAPAGSASGQAPAKRKQGTKHTRDGKGKKEQAKKDERKKDKGKRRRAWVPPSGAILSNPTLRDGRVIIRRILRTVRATKSGEFVRIATWNFADRGATDALLGAKRRGVRVQVVTAGSTHSRPWKRLRRVLDRNRKDKSWARQCRGACRSKGYSMHMKFAIFSKVNRRRHVSMVGSWNLTKAAGERQWNDLVTQADRGLYRVLRKTFSELRRDRNAKPHPTTYRRGRYRLQLWPVYQRNPIAGHLRKVRCRSAGRRTVIRIAIAGWFGSFGNDIAELVRTKWDQGCDIKILTTLAGNGVSRILGAPGGRGPVPIRTLALCCSDYEEGVPSKYLHLKAIAIRGAYGKDDRTHVLLNGSPNWSGDARKADELVLRIRDAGGLVPTYIRRIDQWYGGGIAYRGSTWEPDPRIRFRDDLPHWFQLD